MKHDAGQNRFSEISVALGSLLVITLGGGCSPFDGLEGQSPALRDDGGPDDDRTCRLRRPPGPPPAHDDDARAPDEPPFQLVIRNLVHGDSATADGRPGYETIGFDIDGVCTETHNANACVTAEWATNSPLQNVDGDDGIDNAVGVLLAYLRESGSFSPTTWANDFAINPGFLTYMLRIEGYNGRANDSSVKVAYVEVTLYRPENATSSLRPHWDGADEWLGLDQFFEPYEPVTGPVLLERLPAFKYVTEEAYVSNHQLVMKLTELPANVGRSTDVVLTGTLQRDGERGWTLVRGVVTSRVSTDALLYVVGQSGGALDDAGASMGQPSPLRLPYVCTDHPLYEERKRAACSLADVNHAKDDSRSGLCDGASTAFAFEAVSAKLVGISHLEAVPTCPPGRIPGIDDHCWTDD